MSTKSLLFALAIGLSVGAGVALLFAPGSGADTRRKLKQGAEDAGDYLDDTAAYLKEQAERLSHEAQVLAKRAGASVSEATREAVQKANTSAASAMKTAQGLV